ncbi:hypothetical protein D3C79_639360 [compost metagenome]
MIAGKGTVRLAQQPLDLTNAHPPLEPAQDLADLSDILLAVEPVPLLGTGRLHQAMASLPGPQGDGIDAGQP